MYKNNQKYCKKSYFGVDVQGVTGSSPVSSTTNPLEAVGFKRICGAFAHFFGASDFCVSRLTT